MGTTSETTPGAEHVSWAPWAWLTLGVVAASGSAILIRFAQAHPLALSFWRCAAAAALLVPFGGRGVTRMQRRDLLWPLVAGVFLAVHFGTWITSLELTSVAASVLLVTVSPVFVAFASWVFLGEMLRVAGWLGIGLTLVGTALIAGTDLSGASFDGNVLAFIGGVTAGGYVLAGQLARRQLGIVEYAVVTYSIAGILILPLCVVTDASLWGYDGRTWAMIAAIVIGPQLLGHTVLNFVLKDIDATTVTVAIMAEPVIATALAFLFFSEVPTILIYPGGAAILLGIYLVSSRRKPAAVVVE